MCRYAITSYKAHLACFACRKGFKRRLQRDVDPAGDAHPARCPQCGAPTADMGLDFKPPGRSDTAGWATVASLWEIGVTFHSCGCGGPGYRPRLQRDYLPFLLRLRADYQQQLDAWRGDRRRPEERDRAMAHWRERLQAVEEELRRVGRSTRVKAAARRAMSAHDETLRKLGR